jgi:hypothetical protein
MLVGFPEPLVEMLRLLSDLNIYPEMEGVQLLAVEITVPGRADPGRASKVINAVWAFAPCNNIKNPDTRIKSKLKNLVFMIAIFY